MPRSHEDLLHRVLERASQLLERAREQGRHLGQLPVQRHGGSGYVVRTSLAGSRAAAWAAFIAVRNAASLCPT